MRNFVICTHLQISLADQVKANEVGKACGIPWEGTKKCTRFCWES
jgi:hypothetical protein